MVREVEPGRTFLGRLPEGEDLLAALTDTRPDRGVDEATGLPLWAEAP